MVELSKQNADKEGVSGKATFVKADLFETDLSQATVITMFLLPQINLKLRPKLLDLKPGTRIVSNTFTMEDWQADETATVEDGLHQLVHGPASGSCPPRWKARGKLGNGELALTQQFQMVSGTLGGKPIADGRLRGEQITFTVGDAQYTGTVNGTTMQGTARSGEKTDTWTATRAAK